LLQIRANTLFHNLSISTIEDTAIFSHSCFAGRQFDARFGSATLIAEKTSYLPTSGSADSLPNEDVRRMKQPIIELLD